MATTGLALLSGSDSNDAQNHMPSRNALSTAQSELQNSQRGDKMRRTEPQFRHPTPRPRRAADFIFRSVRFYFRVSLAHFETAASPVREKGERIRLLNRKRLGSRFCFAPKLRPEGFPIETSDHSSKISTFSARPPDRSSGHYPQESFAVFHSSYTSDHCQFITSSCFAGLAHNELFVRVGVTLFSSRALRR